ncbi:antitoxin [Herbidospora yilanensis]|uniref:antitoxin n=1 Tax=Herbidospora yilanensis TaxID=354426 RepID=UPI0007831D4F|nr:antitoxin [Herbidospora yilanensis]
MSFFDKVKDMFGGHHHTQSAPTTPRPQRMPGTEQDGFRDKVEDSVKSGIDSAARKADEMTKGKYRDKINRTAGSARNAADKIDGKQD